MRRAAAFLAFVAPALAWTPVGVWIHSNVEAWWTLRLNLPLSVRIALTVDNAIVRWGVFVGLAVVFAAPLLVLAASRLSSGGMTESRGDVLVWTLLTCLFWAGLVTYLLAMGAVYALLQARHRQLGVGNPRHVLWWAFVALLVAQQLAAVLPGIVWARFRLSQT